MSSRSIVDFWYQLTERLGTAGAASLVLFGCLIGVALLFWRGGRAYLIWAYLVLAFVAVGGQTVSYRRPVLPDALTSVADSLRWAVLMLTAVSGWAYLLLFRIRLDATLLMLIGLAAAALTSVFVWGLEFNAIERTLALALLVSAGLFVYGHMESYGDLIRFMRSWQLVGLGMAVLVVAVVVSRGGNALVEGRFRGFADNPNAMGFIAFSLMAPAAWSWLDSSSKPRQNLVGACSLGFWLLVAVLTGSRAALLCALPIVLASVMIGGKRMAFWITAPLVVPMVAWAAGTFVEVEARSHLQEFEIGSRLDHITTGLRIMSESPFFGHGFGYSALNVRLTGGKPVHNGMVSLGIDLGIVGIAMIGLLGALALWNARMTAQHSRELGGEGTAGWMISALIVSMYLNTMAEGWLTGIGSPQLYLLMILIAVAGASRAALTQQRQALSCANGLSGGAMRVAAA